MRSPAERMTGGSAPVPPADRAEVAPDGSPVAVYDALPVEPEFSAVLGSLHGGERVLDLGCGAGRLADELARRGHEVVAVDESEAMLARLAPAVRPVRARIQDLALPGAFDVVVLASYLANVADDGLRRSLLEACARHVARGGRVLLARYDPVWAARLTREEARVGPVAVTLQVRERRGAVLDLRTAFRMDGVEHVQEHTARILDDTELSAQLEAAGLRLEETLDAWWVAARPLTGSS